MLLHNTLIVLCRHMRCQCTFASRRAGDAASASACAAISVPLIINISLPIPKAANDCIGISGFVNTVLFRLTFYIVISDIHRKSHELNTRPW